MAAESDSLLPQIAVDRSIISAPTGGPSRSLDIDLSTPLQVGIVFVLIIVAGWTRPGAVNAGAILSAALCILWFTVRAGYSVPELGLARPGAGEVLMLLSGTVLVIALVALGLMLNSLGPAHPVPWNRAYQYALWALVQEFILQSFFFVRLESLLGGRRAVWAAAMLFAATHIPSPLLTLLSFGGGLLFCEMFRRHRNIYPLGLVHAALGLTIAASLPDGLLHHMRVGVGYLSYHP
jgi:membrane protease YdiL (CAAX protease family)